jgi:predicted DCC family thiol-disulfide oxidoreductase YuxK
MKKEACFDFLNDIFYQKEFAIVRLKQARINPVMTHHIATIIQKHDIILFDAVCVICNSWAKFLIKYDQHSKFKLVSAQSALGEQILHYYGMSTTHYTTMVVILNGQRYTESTALLKVMQHLGLPFSLMNAGYLLPRPIRDFLYRRIALNRYQLFGTTNNCLLPSAENKSHFLEHAIREL